MADEGYKLQVSLRNGDALFNVRGDEVDELKLHLKELGLDDDAIEELLASFFEGSSKSKKKSSKKSSSKKSKKDEDDDDDDEDDEDDEDDDDDDDDDDDAPSAKQLKFAKQLKIKGASKMGKKELSAAIDKKLAKRK